MPKRTFSFVQLDVFTSRPLEGNQLAVVSDARGLSDDEMQKLARETNLSETTYTLPLLIGGAVATALTGVNIGELRDRARQGAKQSEPRPLGSDSQL